MRERDKQRNKKRGLQKCSSLCLQSSALQAKGNFLFHKQYMQHLPLGSLTSERGSRVLRLASTLLLSQRRHTTQYYASAAVLLQQMQRSAFHLSVSYVPFHPSCSYSSSLSVNCVGSASLSRSLSKKSNCQGKGWFGRLAAQEKKYLLDR